MDNVTFRRRNRLKKHFVITSNVLLFGYPHVSDSAKVTYQVIDSFDWQDGQGLRKGFAYPSVEALASIRSVTDRTIQRHIDELVGADLLAGVTIVSPHPRQKCHPKKDKEKKD